MKIYKNRRLVKSDQFKYFYNAVLPEFPNIELNYSGEKVVLC